ncbi:MAG: hypothetical protein NC344_02910 [Bacteroidales bacterium]|nr:hypothetical protein [Bacteroidales bacterium]MCM1146782.1 hypothetical protein [Bacteroidales bacterium]MCM1205721.1 hypothetical protein [Bacillota bacterium]MCM1510749.1 hypothetical protein [Clostridium sp.]
MSLTGMNVVTICGATAFSYIIILWTISGSTASMPMSHARILTPVYPTTDRNLLAHEG